MKINWEKLDFKKIENWLIVSLAVLLLINLFLISNINFYNPEKAGKVNLKITVINSDCDSCFNVLDLLESLKQQEVNVKKEEILDFSSDKAKALIKKYGITKVPNMVVDGDVEKLNLGIFNKTKGVYVLSKVPLPYVDVATGSVEGLVDVKILVDPLCEECSDAESAVLQLPQLGVVIGEQKIIDVTKDNTIFTRYNLKLVPSVILSGDLEMYDIFPEIKNFFIKTPDGNYILPPQAPYEDMTTGNVLGLVSLINLVDKKCDGCYDVNNHLQVLQSFGIKITDQKTLDISSKEGKKFLSKYGITKVPTIILSSDAKYYSGLVKVWESVGKISEDGSYIFISTEAMGRYKDLGNNSIIG